MPIHLQLMIIRDKTSQSGQLLRELVQAGYDPKWQEIAFEREYLAGLNPDLDLILADSFSSDFDPKHALKLLKVHGSDIPFIVVNGISNDGERKEYMKLGATDYLHKDRLERLGPAVKRALKLKLAEKEIDDLAKFPAENPDPILRISDEGLIIYANPASESLLTEWSIKPGQPLPKDILEKYYKAAKTGLEKISFDVEIADRTFLFTFAPIRENNYTNIYCLDLTERRRAEAAKIESESLYRELFETAPIGLYRTTPGGHILDANPALLNILDYPNLASLQKQEMENIYVRIEDRTKWQRQMEQEGVVEKREVQFYKRDGTKIWVSFSVQAIRDDKGKLMHYEGALEDISERKKAEISNQLQMERLSALRKIDNAINSSLKIGTTLKVFLEQVTNSLKVDAANVLLLNPQTEMLEFAAGRGFHTGALKNTHLRLGEGHAGRAVLEGSMVSIPDLSSNPGSLESSSLLPREAFVAYFAVPLITKGQVIGVLEVFQRKSLKAGKNWLEFLDTLANQAAIAIENAKLFADSQRAQAELIQAYDTTLEGWSKALELRDEETEGHTQRVTEMTVLLANELGLDSEALLQVRRGALLHDIGKMGIPDSILSKPGPLTKEEEEIMRKHPTYAFELLSPITYLESALDIPHSHHEKWDGSGYPRGLKGEQVPLAARIFAVVDVWDALTSDRPYRKAWSDKKALEFIREQSGIHFDPNVVKTFLDLIKNSQN